MTIFEQLVRDEGIRLFPYRDSVGKLTIGVGRNLEDVGISQSEAMHLLNNDVERTIWELEKKLPWFSALEEVRRMVLVNMGFNMGVGGLLEFAKTLSLVRNGQHALAAEEMLDSKWARQVGARALRLAEQMSTGNWA